MSGRTLRRWLVPGAAAGSMVVPMLLGGCFDDVPFGFGGCDECRDCYRGLIGDGEAWTVGTDDPTSPDEASDEGGSTTSGDPQANPPGTVGVRTPDGIFRPRIDPKLQHESPSQTHSPSSPRQP